MTTSTLSATADPGTSSPVASRAPRITSIDALRGLVMFTMIYVNDIAGVSSVPDWMVHFSDRHKGGSGMTFVDLVFPGFLFIVGMSIPFALGSRLDKGEPLWKTLLHVLVRVVSLLAIGILMVNDSSDAEKMGWSNRWLWPTLMYTSVIFAFCSISPPQNSALSAARKKTFRLVSLLLRVAGMASLVYLAFVFRGRGDGHQIITLSPFSIHKSWYGILGLIGWAYLVGAVAFLVFRGHRTALLGCTVLLLCLYPAGRAGLFDDHYLLSHYLGLSWFNRHLVGIGGTMGSQAAITVAGVLLGGILLAPELGAVWARTKFTLLFIAGFSAGAILINGLYGISKNSATPAWCLWSCAITAALWFPLYFLSDVRRVGFIAKPLALAGQNVLLAYILSDLFFFVLMLTHLGNWYGGLARPSLFCAILRSAGCGVFLLCISVGLNRLGFRLKL